ncbi:MAG TPA: carboxypeptidase-like regulatory domain-containing protein [Kofleriaceae bacterium]
MARHAHVLASVALGALGAMGCGDDQRAAPSAPPAKPTAPTAPTSVKIAGTVIDQTSGKPVGDVEVVLISASGEHTARANAGGAFELRVAPGSYRAVVRSETVMSVGFPDRVRLENPPRPELVGARDEALMPLLEARADLTDIELNVTPFAEVVGDIYAADGDDIQDAVVRLRWEDTFFAAPRATQPPALRPALGTDIARSSDDDGYVKLRVPPGNYIVDVFQPNYTTVENAIEVQVRAGEKRELTMPLVRGCIISGRVVDSEGAPAPDGAIERMGVRRDGFGPAGRVDAGTFRLATTDVGPVTLRAWPWRSPPSGPKTFECRDGKRYTDVVLRLPDQRPDMSGVIVDARGMPVPLAYIDVRALDPFVSGQQERADAAGNWHVYDMPPARYRITASAPGLGIVDTVVVAPRQDMRLALGGTGRIVGTATELVTGSVEVSFMHCGPQDQPQLIPHETRIVPVIGGSFTIERAPACTLTFAVRHRDKLVQQNVVVEPDRTAYIEVDIGTPREKTVTGVVRDAGGDGVAGARVTAVLGERETETARTDASGRYTLKTHSGAQLVGSKDAKLGRGRVGRANVASEQVDLVLDEERH